MQLPSLITSSNMVDHLFFCGLGILVSAYALYVEIKKSKDPKYVAICDIGENMSCSKVLTSKYSKGFGIAEYLLGKDSFFNAPNCVLGIVFYSSQLLLALGHQPWMLQLLFYSSCLSVIGSLYLAIILAFVLKDLCLVCITTYVINGALLYLNYSKLVY